MRDEFPLGVLVFFASLLGFMLLMSESPESNEDCNAVLDRQSRLSLAVRMVPDDNQLRADHLDAVAAAEACTRGR